MSRQDELSAVRAQMNSAPQGGPPEEVREPVQQPMPLMEEKPVSPQPDTGGEITIMDFLQTANASPYVDKMWASKNKKVKIKRFNRGELDKISAPLLKKTMKLDLAGFDAQKHGAVPMNVEISMDMFTQMEKIMVELGMIFYKDKDGKPVINQHYIENYMPDSDFKELSALIQEVNPKALMTSVQGLEQVDKVKK